MVARKSVALLVAWGCAASLKRTHLQIFSFSTRRSAFDRPIPLPDDARRDARGAGLQRDACCAGSSLWPDGYLSLSPLGPLALLSLNACREAWLLNCRAQRLAVSTLFVTKRCQHRVTQILLH